MRLGGASLQPPTLCEVFSAAFECAGAAAIKQEAVTNERRRAEILIPNLDATSFHIFFSMPKEMEEPDSRRVRNEDYQGGMDPRRAVSRILSAPLAGRRESFV